jgi:hypothetical protein
MSQSSTKVVAFISPFHLTTSGHQNIAQLIASALRVIGIQTLLCPFCGPQALQLLQHYKVPISGVIVDYPDAELTPTLAQLKGNFVNVPWVGLAMYLDDAADKGFVNYDYILEMEPAAGDSKPQRITRIGGSPVVRSRNVAYPTDAQTRWLDGVASGEETLLIMQTGNSDERVALGHYGEMIAATKHAIPIWSRAAPQPAARLMRAATHIYAATGYSTVWECVAVGAFKRAEWQHLVRPVEGLARRLAIASTIQPNQVRNELYVASELQKVGF